MRRSELVGGVLAALATWGGVAVLWLAPYTSYSGREYLNGRLVATYYGSTTFAEHAGTMRTIGVSAMFAVFGLWIVLVASAHVRTRERQWLRMLWAGAALLSVLAFISAPALVYLFWPAALFGLLCAFIATLWQFSPA